MSTISVLLVDDHAIVREGYRRLLAQHADIALVGEALDATQAYAQFCALSPRVVVMDIGLPGQSGIHALTRMLAREPDARVVVYSMHDELVYVRKSLQAGALGYVSKRCAPETLVEAIRHAAMRRRYLSPDVAQAMAMPAQSEEERALQSLTAREFEVLRGLLEGESVAAIAERLSITAKTVANLQSSLKQKLNVDTATQLVRLGLRNGLLGSSGAP